MVWGTHIAPVLEKEQLSTPSPPGDAEGLFSCLECAFLKDTSAAQVRLVQA